ncbi:MAG: flagellar filament capping protein FliD [Fimbriimonas sp.]
MSLSGITFGGLSSGIDTESIISRLVQLEAIPIQRLETQQAQIQAKQSVYSQFRSRLSAFAQAAGSMNIADTFNPVTAGSTKMDVAILTGSSSATAGTYNLQVSKLAQAQKVATAAKTDTTTALGLTAGTIVVNGKALAVDQTDSLRTIAQKMNSLGAGVTASLIDGGTGNAYMTISSSATGEANRIQLADLTGDVLTQLGMTSGAATVRTPATNGAKSFTFTSTTDNLKTALGSPTGGAATFSIDGTDVSVDLSTDTLQGVADKINGAGTGASATVVSSTKDGKTLYQLEITGTSTPTFTDPDNVLQGLGILQKGYGNELVAAQDAEFKLDNVSLKNSTNVVTNAIPGATLTLVKANATTPETSVLTLSRDTNAIKGKIKAFADSYNDLVSFIDSNSQFDKDSYRSGTLFGDSTAQQVESTMSSMLFNDIPGLDGPYKNLAAVGFKFDKEGKLTADDAILNAAIAADPAAVGAVFRSTGAGSVDGLTYVSSTTATKASGASAFNVEITQVATKGKMTSNIAQTTANAVSEKLTFSGSTFGGTPYVLNLDVGSTLATTVDKINRDAKLKDLVAARIEDGKLVIDSRRFGSAGNFSVMSNLASAADNSGIGHAGGVVANGVDVMGTINGQASTGSGQFLTANADTGAASGLQIQYTGSTTGSIGSIKFRKGVGTQANDLVGSFTDALNGLLTTADKSMQSQIDGLQEKITSMNERITRKQQELKARFARMEEAIAKVQSQGTSMSSFFASQRSS